jgi:hypothetical protein
VPYALTGAATLPQRVDDERADRDLPPPRRRLRLARHAVPIDALLHLDDAALEVDVLPAKSPYLRRPEPGECRCRDDRPVAALGGVEKGLDLGDEREVLPGLDLPLAAPVYADGSVGCRVHCHGAAPLGVLEEGFERGEHLAGHRPG